MKVPAVMSQTAYAVALVMLFAFAPGCSDSGDNGDVDVAEDSIDTSGELDTTPETIALSAESEWVGPTGLLVDVAAADLDITKIVFSVAQDDEEARNVFVDVASPFEFEVDPSLHALSEGPVTVTGLATLQDGGRVPTTSIELTVDVTAPTATAEATTDAPGVSFRFTDAVSGGDLFGSEVSGTFEAGAGTATLSEGSDYVRDTSTAGVLTIVITQPSNGLFTFELVPKDRAGNVGTPVVATHTHTDAIDEPPLVSITEPNAQTVLTGTASVTFALEAGGPLASSELGLSGVNGGASSATLNGGTRTGTIDTLPVEDGLATLSVTARDATDETGSDAILVTVDNLPPEVVSLTPEDGAALTGVVMVELTALDVGTGVASVEAHVDGAPNPLLTTPVEPAAGVATLVSGLELGLAPGTREVVFSVKDATGKVSEVSRTWTIAAGPPVATVTPTSSSVPTSGFPTVNIAIVGSAPANMAATLASVSVIHDGLNDVTSTLVMQDTGGGTATIDLPNAPPGTYSLSLTPSDTSGQLGSVVIRSYVVDALPPSVLLQAPVMGQFFTTGVPVIADASDNDEVSSVTLSITDGVSSNELTLLAPPFTASLPTSGLSDGLITVKASAIDRASNSDSAERTIFVDRTPPTIETVGPAATVQPATFQMTILANDTGGIGVKTATVRLGSATGDILAQQTMSDAMQFNLFLLTITTPVPGPTTLHISVADSLGNVATTSVDYTIDSGVPTAALAPPSGIRSSLTSVTVDVYGTGSGASTGDAVSTQSTLFVTKDGAPFSSFSTQNIDGDTFVINFTGLAAGLYTVTVTPRDSNGTGGTPTTVTYTLDPTPPSLSIVAPVANEAIGGQAVSVVLDPSDPGGLDSAVVTLTDANNLSVSETVSGFPWNVELDLAALVDGPATLTAVVTDLAGNPRTVSIAVRIDNQPPVINWMSPASGTSPGSNFLVRVSTSDAGSGLDRLEVHLDSPTGPLVGVDEIGGAPTSATFEAPTTVSQHGAVTLYARVSDLAGRVATTEAMYLIDTEPPTVSFSPPTGSVIAGNLSFTISLDDGTAAWDSGADNSATIASISATVSGQPFTSFTTATTANGIVVVLTDSPSGTVVFTLEPTDLAGNAAPPTQVIYVVDSLPPGIISTVPSDGDVGVSPVAEVTMTFSDTLVPSSVTDQSVTVSAGGVPIAGTLEVLSGPSRIVWRPAEPMVAYETIDVVVGDGIQFNSGPVLQADFPFDFSVGEFAFVERTMEFGLSDYRGDTAEDGERHGPGTTFADLDADGFPELVLTTGPGEPTLLFRNIPHPAGAGRSFEPAPFDTSRLDGGVGSVVADYDNDGDIDIYVCNYGTTNILYQNQLVETGSLSFVDVTDSTAPAGSGPSQQGVGYGVEGSDQLLLTMTCAWADVNRDGNLDLYAANHNGFFGNPDVGFKPGQRDTLWLNQGDGTFVDVTLDANVPGYLSATGATITSTQAYSSSNAVAFGDLNNDMWPDLIVTNKLRHSKDRDMIYINLGTDGAGDWLGYEVLNDDLSPVWGSTNLLSMGVDIADWDNDGDLDFYITDWGPFGQVPGPNELWLNQLSETGQLAFEQATCCTGVYSWGPQFQDFDNDGLLDLHVSTNSGYRDLMYRQLPNGAVEEVAAEWGIEQDENSRGNPIADFDGDGWLDLWIVNLETSSVFYQNLLGDGQSANNHWLHVSLVGDPTTVGALRSTRDAIGARIEVTADIDGSGTLKTLTRFVKSGSSNAASSSSLIAEFGLGLDTQVDVTVYWPSGATSTLSDVAADQRITITE